MENTDTDVIVVGGGPAGLMLAIELGRWNIRCILFDEDDSTTPNPQANATQARTMEHFRRLGFADEVCRGHAARLSDGYRLLHVIFEI